jgi:hypothetical protein
MARTSPKRIAIFIDKPDWHARRLAAAFAARDLDSVFVPLRSCRFHIGGGGLVLPGFQARLPEGGFVRCVPGGSFEQVTLRLGVLGAVQRRPGHRALRGQVHDLAPAGPGRAADAGHLGHRIPR